MIVLRILTIGAGGLVAIVFSLFLSWRRELRRNWDAGGVWERDRAAYMARKPRIWSMEYERSQRRRSTTLQQLDDATEPWER